MEQLNLKAQYFKEQLQKGFQQIFQAQRAVAANKLRLSGAKPDSRSGALMAALSSPKYQITPQGAGVHAVISYPISIRFQDMKHLGNWRIYNRQIWGILYKETFVNIRYEFSDWLRKGLHRQLQEAINPLNTNSK